MSNVDKAAAQRLFHHWLIFATLIVFGAHLAYVSGVYLHVLENDPSRLSIVISILFVGGSLHCGLLSLRLSREDAALRDLAARMDDDIALMAGRLGTPSGATRAAAVDYFAGLAARLAPPASGQAGEYTQLTDVFAEDVRGQHESGWFVTNMLVKLGLLGTVIGFILMLSSVMAIESFDIADAQGLLGRMTIGMGVALNTTMLGLVCSMALGMQYLLVDRGADRLIAKAVYLAESRLIPHLAGRRNEADGPDRPGNPDSPGGV